ncbi:hydroxyisourate hydrolase [Oricola cellulosilytica]|uniref:5-hydroxyisourate hydrolase n=1 Tax=Oricola cellulosilytica TaxID=1429082 RepID=A0A4R0P3T4_9HYPH|nr:hydroxyisourate hydrolase [Oricola cellulosilytica]TCD11299.1 hydroxyisourate hydrolase [Oricola cellulosilytica]
MAGKLSTHVLDTANGHPAAGMRLTLYKASPGAEKLEVVKSVVTNADGRTVDPLLATGEIEKGTYEIHFEVAAYYAHRPGANTSDAPFLDTVPVRFTIGDPEAGYHVPLLVTPWSYATYRGS